MGRNVVRRNWFEGFIQLAILIVAINTGLALDMKEGSQLARVSTIVNYVLLAVFTLEVILKMMAEGTRWWQFFMGESWAWNIFDFTIVVTSLILLSSESGGTVSILRLMRIMRLVKFMKGFRKLHMIMIGREGRILALL